MMKDLGSFKLIDENHNSFSINSDGWVEMETCHIGDGDTHWTCVSYILSWDDISKLKRVLNTITKRAKKGELT